MKKAFSKFGFFSKVKISLVPRKNCVSSICENKLDTLDSVYYLDNYKFKFSAELSLETCFDFADDDSLNVLWRSICFSLIYFTLKVDT